MRRMLQSKISKNNFAKIFSKDAQRKHTLCFRGGGLPITAYTRGGMRIVRKGTFFRLQVYKRVGISQVEVHGRVGQLVIWMQREEELNKRYVFG